MMPIMANMFSIIMYKLDVFKINHSLFLTIIVYEPYSLDNVTGYNCLRSKRLNINKPHNALTMLKCIHVTYGGFKKQQGTGGIKYPFNAFPPKKFTQYMCM
jgi:hypothetical protein